jgi:hypothetical protein
LKWYVLKKLKDIPLTFTSESNKIAAIVLDHVKMQNESDVINHQLFYNKNSTITYNYNFGDIIFLEKDDMYVEFWNNV